MKTTIEIADDLFLRAQSLARERDTTFRAVTEEGLRLLLDQAAAVTPSQLPPLVTYGSGGPTDAFADWDWDQVRDELYRGRGT